MSEWTQKRGCSLGLGKAIKDIMKKMFKADFDERHDAWCDDKVKAGERRLLQTQCVKKSWDEFFKEGGKKQESV